MLDSILGLLGLRPSSDGGDDDTLQEIAGRLERLPPERARYVAAFAVVLSRVAHADLDIADAERERMERLLVERGGLSAEEAATAVRIAVRRSHVSAGTDHFLATRELATIATREQREDLLECLFSVSAADGSISTAEENRIRQVASELGFGHREFAAARSHWNEHREILR